MRLSISPTNSSRMPDASGCGNHGIKYSTPQCPTTSTSSRLQKAVASIDPSPESLDQTTSPLTLSTHHLPPPRVINPRTARSSIYYPARTNVLLLRAHKSYRRKQNTNTKPPPPARLPRPRRRAPPHMPLADYLPEYLTASEAGIMGFFAAAVQHIAPIL